MEINSNFLVLDREIAWLKAVIDQAIASYLLQEGQGQDWREIPLPDLTDCDCSYRDVVMKWELSIYERLALVLAIAPHLKPEILDVFFSRNQVFDRRFTEFGGVTNQNHSGFLPTGQTLSFLIAGSNLALKAVVFKIFQKENRLIKEQVLTLSLTESHIPGLNGVLSVDEGWLHYFLTGVEMEPASSRSFPAQKLTTSMTWADLVLDQGVMEQVQEINNWLTHGEALLHDWGLFKKIKPGYSTLFCGLPGTGKTLTASLIGKVSQRDVYRVDLSMLVSKYIGETEKNLAELFDTAAHKNWILFFDEADALFSERNVDKRSPDLYGNLNPGYLLQKIADFPGVVILAANCRANVADAFGSRFQSIIHFNLPSAAERYQLWQNAFTGVCTLSDDVDLRQISAAYELTGGSINNVLRHCALSAIARNVTLIHQQDLLTGIESTYKKENPSISRLH